MFNEENGQSIPKISKKQFEVLRLLITQGHMYGLEMVKASDGLLKMGTVYVVLQQMSNDGLVESEIESRTPPEIGIPRRIYRITGLGEKVYRAYEAAHRTLNLAWGS